MIARPYHIFPLLALLVAAPLFSADESQPAPETAPATKTSAVIAGSHELKNFNFEEVKLGNLDDIPMFWQKVVGRGYPIYATGKFDHAVSRSASTSFRLDLDGGSIAYRLMANKIPIDPAADYFVVGWVKTTDLKHARAEITAWLADESGALIPATEGHSNATTPKKSDSPAVLPATSTATDSGEWRALQLYIPGTDNPHAKSLVLQLGLLQPQQLTPGILGKFELYQQDLKGSAWFDDIVVFQLPRVSIATRDTANVFTPEQNVDLDITVSDLGREALDAAVTIADVTGKEVWKDQWHVMAEAVSNGKPWIKHVQRPPLPPGLYTASLDVIDAAGRAPITRRQVKFVSLAPAEIPRGGYKEFGIDIDNWPADAWDQVPHLLKITGSGLISLPAWRRDMTDEALLRRDPPLDNLVLALMKADTRALASFPEIPAVLAQKIAAAPGKAGAKPLDDSILSLFDANPEIWRPYTSFILARFASRVNYWELGSPADALHAPDPRLPKAYARAHTELANLLNSPHMLLPWNALYDFDSNAFPNAMLDLYIPPAVKPAQIPASLASFRNIGVECFVRLEPLDYKTTPRLDLLSDFAKRVVYTRSANPLATLIDLPMKRHTENFAQSSQPDEVLVVYRTLVATLGGEKFIREFTPVPGVHAFLFDKAGKGVLVMWTDADKPLTLSMPVGETPAQIDIWGNLTALPVDHARTTFTLSSIPTFLSNVDTNLVELHASFAFATAKFPAGAGSIRTSVRLHNPYPSVLTGKLQFTPLKGWSFDPPSVPVNLKSGETLDAAVTVAYPFNEASGPKTLSAHFTPATGDAINMAFQAAVTSDIVNMEAHAAIGADGQLAIQVVITNISQNIINAQAYSLVPTLARQQRYVIELKPGETTIKHFTYHLTDPAGFVGKTASIGLRQNDGKTLITKSVPLE